MPQPDGWYPEEKLTRSEALVGFTVDAAYASFSENEMGSIEPGKYVLLSIVIFTTMLIDVHWTWK